MSLIDKLRALAVTVRNEKKKEANTAIRIGDLFLAIIDFVKGVQSGEIRQKGVDTYNETSGEKSSLLNQYPNPELNWTALVRKDETAGGKASLYKWNGSSWINLETVVYSDDIIAKTDIVNSLTEGGEDKPLSAEQGRALNDNKADKSQVVSKVSYTNLFEGVTWTNNKYLNSSGNEATLAGCSISDFISINPNDKYYLVFKEIKGELYSGIWGSVYDNEKILKGYCYQSHANQISAFEFNALPAYIRLNVSTVNIPYALFLSEADYEIYKNEKLIDAIKILNRGNLFSGINGVSVNKNLLVQNLGITKGGYLGNNNNIIENVNFGYTKKIAVKGNTEYHTNLQANYAAFCQYFDKDGNYSGYWGGGSQTGDSTFTTPSGCAELRFTISLSSNVADKFYNKYLRENSPEEISLHGSGSISHVEVSNIQGATPIVAKNLCANYKVYGNGYFRDDQVWTESPSFRTIYFAVLPDTEYVFNQDLGANNGWFADKAGLLIRKVGGSGASSEKHTTKSPGNAAMVYLTVEATKISTKFFKALQIVNDETAGNVLVPTIVEPEKKTPVLPTYNLSMRNDNTFVGAMNTIIDAFIFANPRIRIVMSTHFTKDGRNSGVNGSLKNVVDTQLKIAEYWGIPCLDLSSKCGWVKKTSAKTVVNTIRPFFTDQLHPATDATGQSSIMLKDFFVDFLYPIFGSEWAEKRVAIAGTSITAGHGSSEKWAKHIDEAVLELGGIPVNYAVSGRTARLKTVDGTLIENSFMNTNAAKNYTIIADGIASGDFDLIILDHGINDEQLDRTDFEIEY